MRPPNQRPSLPQDKKSRGRRYKKKDVRGAKSYSYVCPTEHNGKKGKLFKTYPDRHPRQPNLSVRCIHQIKRASTVAPYKWLEP